jgi:hypothetical protein
MQDILSARINVKRALDIINRDILRSIMTCDGKYGILSERRSNMETILFNLDDLGVDMFGSRAAYVAALEARTW